MSDPSTLQALEERINARLPQTQCGKCGHGGCRPYARAISSGEPINRCPPGGEPTIRALAELLGRPVVPLDTTYGEYAPLLRAYIREDECIGCTKCIQACPTDAILGGAKRMHTVIETECTGCQLCVAPCPVDCIDMLPARTATEPTVDTEQGRQQARYWQQRHDAREERLTQLAQVRQEAKTQRLQVRQPEASVGELASKSPEQLRREIQEAVARAQARRAAGQKNSR